MKKISTYILLLSLSSAVFSGCGSSKNSTKDILGGTSGSVVKTVTTIIGVILLSKIIKSVLNTVGGSTAFAGTPNAQNFTANFNEDTKLNSFAQNDLLKAALQVLVAEHYQIPLTKVANSYSSLTTVGDLATFIGQNASAKALTPIK